MELNIINNVPVYLPEKGRIVSWFIQENQPFKSNQKIAEALCSDQIVEIKTIEKGILKKIHIQVGQTADSEFVLSFYHLN